MTRFTRNILLRTTAMVGALCLSAMAGSAAITGNADQPSAGSSDAKGESAPQLETIVVTAMRNKSEASKTPVALTALTGDMLETKNVSTVSSLGEYVPNLTFDQIGTATRITIRGVTSQDTTEKGDPSAAFMLDDIYIARPEAQNVSFYDVARVEVLRGPQGTLYGRNTTAGVVNVITNEPVETQSGAFNATYGNLGSRLVDGYYNLPVTDWLDLRAAVSYNHHDPYLINNQGNDYNPGADRDDFSGRLSAKLKFGEDAFLVLRADDSQIHTVPGWFVLASNFYQNTPGGLVWKNPASDDARTISFVPPNGGLAATVNPKANNSTWGITSDFNWDLGPVTLTYEAAHRNFKRDELYNSLLAMGADFGSRTTMRGVYVSDSHELRVSLNNGGRLQAQAGVYYFKEGANINACFHDFDALTGFPSYCFPQGPIKAISKAVFGQATYEILDGLRLTGGLRYSEDNKARHGRTILGTTDFYHPATDVVISLNSAEYKSTKMTWRAGAEYDVTSDIMWFGTVSTGYKAGGFNDGCVAGTVYYGMTCGASNGARDPIALFYKPETLTSYESGVKSTFFNRRVELNTTLFYYQYSNLQLSGTVMVGTAPQAVVTNATSAKVYGVEMEGQALLTDVDSINYSASLLDAHYGNYSPNGVVSWTHLPLDNSPKWTFSLGYDRTFKLPNADLVLSLYTRWTGKYDLTVAAAPARWTVPSYHKSDVSLRYQPDGKTWNIQVFAKNLEDKVVPMSMSVDVAMPSEPRTYGVRLGFKF